MGRPRSVENMTTAEKVLAFMRCLKIPDGAHVGKSFVPMPWQEEIVRRVYDDIDPATGRRRIRQAVLSLPRKNGKTAMVAALCLAHICGPVAEKNAQLYSVAFDREQASILYKYMASMILMEPYLTSRLHIVDSRRRILDKVLGNEFQALSSESRSKHGRSSAFIAFDELAQFGADRELYDVMMTSRGAHAEPLVWVFSTQAEDDSALLSELLDYGERVRNGEIDDPSFVSWCYSAPPGADIWSEETWRACNPALGIYRSIEEFREYATRARALPSMEPSFRNLYLNQRVNVTSSWVSRDVWVACSEPPDDAVLREGPCIAAMDLSSSRDLSALVLAREVEGVWHVKTWVWVPAAGLRERERIERVPYRAWADAGVIETTPGRVLDYRTIAQKVFDIFEKYPVSVFRYDRWRIDYLRRELEDLGARFWEWGKDSFDPAAICLQVHGQGYKDMSPAVEQLEALLVDRKLRHGGHPLLTYGAASAKIETDAAGNRKLSKKRSSGRIDAIIALAMAVSPIGRRVDTRPSIYELGDVWA